MDEAQYLALAPEQRKSLQRQWQAQGIYAGPIDGKSGNGVRTALSAAKAAQDSQAQNQLRQQELENQKLQLQGQQEIEKLKLQGQQKTGENAEKLRQEREAAADPTWDTFLPFAGGVVTGGVYGELANRGLDRFERGNVEALKEIGDELGPSNRLTSSQINRSRAVGAATAAERFAPANPLLKGLNAAGRAASYGIPAGVVYNEYSNYQKRADDPNLTDKERKANQRVANLLFGVTTGIGVEGGRRFFFPARAPGMGEAMMRIQTARDFAQRMDRADAQPKEPKTRAPKAVTPPQSAPAVPSPTAPAPAVSPPPASADPLVGSKTDLKAQAKRMGLSVQGTKQEIEQRIANRLLENQGARVRKPKAEPGGTGGKLMSIAAPVMVGAVAAQGAYHDARAAGETPVEAAGDAALTAGTVGGAAGATAYGVNRLLRRLPSAVGQAFSMAGDASAPAMIDAMTDYSPDEIAQGRNWIARNIPAARHFGGGFQQGYEMAQVPEPGARSPAAMQARSQVNARTPDNDFDLALEDLRALLAASGPGADEGMMAPDGALQPMQASPMAYYPPAMAADNRLLRRF
jgi:hypothetical protein